MCAITPKGVDVYYNDKKLNVKDCLNAIVGAVEEISGKINSNNQSMKKRKCFAPFPRPDLDGGAESMIVKAALEQSVDSTDSF